MVPDVSCFFHTTTDYFAIIELEPATSSHIL